MTTNNTPGSVGTRAEANGRPSAPVRALGWLRVHELGTGGIRVHSHHMRAYAEVTGYIVPTLLEYGERELAIRLVHWLLSAQTSEGHFTDPDEREPYVFDPAQVLRALLASAALGPAAPQPAPRAP